jgi:peptidoglycan/xylan/chitin deacetylase (PgdA/CDA1 family)
VSIKQSMKKALLASGALRAWNALQPPGVLVVRYHCIQPAFDESNAFLRGIVHLSSDFEQHMAIIARNFHPVSLEDIYQAQVQGKPLPRRSVCVTFDDGFKDNLEIAAPIMEKHGVVGTIYVTTGLLKNEINPWFVRVRRAFHISTEKTYPGMEGTAYDLDDPAGRRAGFLEASRLCATSTGEKQQDLVQKVEQYLSVAPLDEYMMMTEEQVRQTAERGHIIGSHTVAHPNMAHVPAAILQQELVESKAALDGLTGRSCHHFSYPRPILSPHYTEATGAAARAAGYVTAVTCTDGLVRPDDDLMAIKRISAPFAALEFEVGLEKMFSGIWKEP